MMTRLKILIALALLIPALAKAAPITVISTDGSWSGAVPVATIDNTDVGGVPSTIRWGSGPHQSGYDYTPVIGPFGVLVDGAAFLLGTFTHHNWPITGTSLTGVNLDFNLDWSTFSPDLAGGFAFAHHETPNGANPCAYAGANGQGINGAGCADRVMVNSPFLNTLVNNGIDTYFFTLVGFSTDGGNTASHQYLTREGQTNTAGLYGRLTSIPILPDDDPEPVPEPATLALLGLGLAGLGYKLRRSKFVMALVLGVGITPAAAQSVVVDGDVTINSTRPLIFPVEEGTPGNGVVHAIKLGGAGEEDIFVSLHDAQPGTGPATNSRGLVLYSRQTTAALPVAHSSLFLSGWWWDPAFGLPVQRAIELENKVMLNGQAQFWLEEIIGTTPTTPGSGKPFMRFFRTPNLNFPTDNGHIATHDQPGAQLTLDARDTNDGVWRSFLTVTAGATPSLSIAPPSGGTVKLRAIYWSNDGTLGLTKTCTRPITAATIRNGLITAVTCP